jgi:1,2-diacylglycerol 3-beta-glucosyltransferase
LDANFQCGRDSIRGAVELRGNGQLVKRKALEHVGLWNVHTVTDDLDLSTKLHLAGWDIRFAHKVLVWEEGITEFFPLLRQRRRWAEGSLRRYLEYAGDLLMGSQVSLRTKADMIAYLVEFLFPLWVVSDYAMVGLDILTGDATRGHLISSLIVLPLLTVFFVSGLFGSILRFNKPSFLDTAIGALMTSLYMTWVWLPIVFWIMVKILFQREHTLNWGKTKHYGASTPSPLETDRDSAVLNLVQD